MVRNKILPNITLAGNTTDSFFGGKMLPRKQRSKTPMLCQNTTNIYFSFSLSFPSHKIKYISVALSRKVLVMIFLWKVPLRDKGGASFLNRFLLLWNNLLSVTK